MESQKPPLPLPCFPEQEMVDECLNYLDTEQLSNLRLVSRMWSNYIMDSTNHSKFWSGKPKPVPTPQIIRWANPLQWANNRDFWVRLQDPDGPTQLRWYQKSYGEPPDRLFGAQMLLQFWFCILPTFTSVLFSLYLHLSWLDTAPWEVFLVWCFLVIYWYGVLACFAWGSYRWLYDNYRMQSTHTQEGIVSGLTLWFFPFFLSFKFDADCYIQSLWVISSFLALNEAPRGPEHILPTALWEWVTSIFAAQYYPVVSVVSILAFAFELIKGNRLQDLGSDHVAPCCVLLLGVGFGLEIISFFSGKFFWKLGPLFGVFCFRLGFAAPLETPRSNIVITQLKLLFRKPNFIWILDWIIALCCLSFPYWMGYAVQESRRSAAAYTPPWKVVDAPVCKLGDYVNQSGVLLG